MGIDMNAEFGAQGIVLSPMYGPTPVQKPVQPMKTLSQVLAEAGLQQLRKDDEEQKEEAHGQGEEEARTEEAGLQGSEPQGGGLQGRWAAIEEPASPARGTEVEESGSQESPRTRS